jgi:choline dehydrogenase-like flavoprotein
LRIADRESEQDVQIINPATVHPVIVIGSGASGGMAAWNLTQKGIDVLLLDAGDKFDRAKYWTHVQPWEAQEREARGEKPPQFFLDTKEQPYVTPEGRPFELTRVWGHGGKTNVWGRVSLRYSQMDLKAAERDGWEIPWPIEYSEIAPYYDQVEQLIGVCGGTDDSEILPGSKFLQPPPAPRCGERLLMKGMAKLGLPVVPASHPRISRLPLLRELRRRMRYRVFLLLGGSPAAVRVEDRPPENPVQRRGRADPDRR